MSYFGLVLGCILFISCGGLAYLSISILCEAMQISGKRRYPNLVSYFLGKKSAKVFSKILIGVVFGIVI